MLSGAMVKRLLVVAAFLPAVFIGLIGLRRDHSPIPVPVHEPPPNFEMVKQRYQDVRFLLTRKEAEQLLGPPTEIAVREPELVDRLEQIEFWNRHLGLPDGRVWVRWTDPNDKETSITVLFADEKVYYKLKSGF
jgi:hypothetical protein